jgi:hypothetical protein
MRKTVEPPPAAHCEHCGGLLTLKSIDATRSTWGMVRQTYVCSRCNAEHALVAPRDDYTPRDRQQHG